jgi:HSP20 family protein
MAQEKSEGKSVTRSESGRTERMPRAMSPWEEMDRMFESVFPQAWRPFLGRMWGDTEGMHPRVDVIDRDTEIMVRAEIPGVDKENIDVSVTDNTVTIRGETHRESEETQGQYYRSEISHGAFTRTVALPAEVDADGANASFKNGMLELKLPKVEKSKRRSIPVN